MCPLLAKLRSESLSRDRNEILEAEQHLIFSHFTDGAKQI